MSLFKNRAEYWFRRKIYELPGLGNSLINKNLKIKVGAYSELL